MTQDDIRANFLLALDRAEDVNVSAFEAEFIESNLARFSFSPKQRVVIDKLMAKYEVAINFNPDRPKLAERAAKEEAVWNRDPKRMVAKAPKPTVNRGQLGWKQFAQQMPSNQFAARPRPARPTAHIKEKLRRNNSIPEWRLSWFPVKPGTVKRNGARLEEWFIDYATGVLHDCPFLQDGDEMEYDHYTDIHG